MPPKTRRPATRIAAADPHHDAYPLRTVSKLTGLSPDVIRAWERRYSVVSPLRGPRGARLYSSADVAHLRLLGNVVARGRAIGDVASLAPDALQKLATDPMAARQLETTGSDDALLERIVGAVRAFDAVEVERLLGEALLGLGIGEFISRVGIPLLERVGELWQRGELSVAEEHLASSTVRSLFGGLMRLRLPRRPPAFLLTAPGGERHELGLSMVALLCMQAGVGVAYAGPDLPAAEVVEAARRTGVSVVGLSLISSTNRENAVEQVRSIEKALPSGIELWLGGKDAAAVAERLGRTRAVVLQRIPAIEREIARIAARQAG